MLKFIPLFVGVVIGLGLGFLLGSPIVFAVYGLVGGALAQHFPARTETISWFLVVGCLVLFTLGAAGVNFPGAFVFGPIVSLLALWGGRFFGRLFGIKAA